MDTESVLTGNIPIRIKKYRTEEERQYGKWLAYKKYADKKYHCQICNKTMTLYNYSDHLKTKIHLKNSFIQ